MVRLYQVQGQFKGFEVGIIEDILRYSTERYFDTVTRRMIAVGKHGDRLLMIPYEREGEIIAPVTVHATTRQQISFRVKTGRFIYE